jgi:hypothetical protein
MAKDDRNGKGGKLDIEIGELVHVHQELDMPAERGNAVGQGPECAGGRMPLSNFKSL